MPVAEIQTNAIHERLVADGEAVVVNGQVDDLSAERRGNEGANARTRRVERILAGRVTAPMYDRDAWRFRNRPARRELKGKSASIRSMRPSFTILLALSLAACARVQYRFDAGTGGVSARDLERRLTAFAHDSMMGREAGTIWNQKATDYVAAEFREARSATRGRERRLLPDRSNIRPSDARYSRTGAQRHRP